LRQVKSRPSEECKIKTRFTETSMLDVIFLAVAIGFFAVAIAYAYACDRL
jgi:hypothetical protein